MTPERLDKWRKLCNELVTYCQNAPKGSILSYAVSYAKAGLNLCTEDEVSSQAIYIANNVKHVKGPKGKDFKQRLREFY